MTGAPNLVLAGFMGTGKTTVGGIVARQLAAPLVDTDAAIEADAGMSVAAIFAERGETAFRTLERAVCERLSDARGQVVALGGGALLDPRNRRCLERGGVIVLLRCGPHTLVERLRESARRGERPLLAGDLEERVARLLAEREAVYGEIPLQVDTTHLSRQQAAERVLSLYRAATPEGAGAALP